MNHFVWFYRISWNKSRPIFDIDIIRKFLLSLIGNGRNVDVVSLVIAVTGWKW